MKLKQFPTSATDAAEWAKRYRVPEELAIRRWIKFAALDCLARDEALANTIIIRGSLGISFYDPTNRLGEDIDIYSTSLPPLASDEDVARVKADLNNVMHTWLPAHFPDLRKWSAKIKDEIKIEVMSLQYDVQWNNFRLPSPSNRSIRVAKLECLISEKLLALLHHARCVSLDRVSKSRSKDVLDIYHILTCCNQPIDLPKVIYHFNGQNEAMKDGVFVLAKSSFNASVCSLAAENYTGKMHERAATVPFEKAWGSIMAFVDGASDIK